MITFGPPENLEKSPPLSIWTLNCTCKAPLLTGTQVQLPGTMKPKLERQGPVKGKWFIQVLATWEDGRLMTQRGF